MQLTVLWWFGLIQLEKKVSEQAARIHELELLSPGEDGEYKLLKQELKDLEKVSSVWPFMVPESQPVLTSIDPFANPAGL